MDSFLRIMRNRLHRPSSTHVQILSGLHLEVGQQYTTYKFPKAAPLLLLGGDIGQLIDYDGYLDFLKLQASRYEKVFLVLGNHEFYGLDYESGIGETRRLSQEPCLAGTLILLNRCQWDDPGSTLTILGCTLWSAIPKDAHDIVESKISDFKKIQNWTVEKHSRAHGEEAAWLRAQVAEVAALQDNKATARRLLVATHHAPSLEGTSRPEHSSSP